MDHKIFITIFALRAPRLLLHYYETVSINFIIIIIDAFRMFNKINRKYKQIIECILYATVNSRLFERIIFIFILFLID